MEHLSITAGVLFMHGGAICEEENKVLYMRVYGNAGGWIWSWRPKRQSDKVRRCFRMWRMELFTFPSVQTRRIAVM